MLPFLERSCRRAGVWHPMVSAEVVRAQAVEAVAALALDMVLVPVLRLLPCCVLHARL